MVLHFNSKNVKCSDTYQKKFKTYTSFPVLCYINFYFFCGESKIYLFYNVQKLFFLNYIG